MFLEQWSSSSIFASLFYKKSSSSACFAIVQDCNALQFQFDQIWNTRAILHHHYNYQHQHFINILYLIRAGGCGGEGDGGLIFGHVKSLLIDLTSNLYLYILFGWRNIRKKFSLQFFITWKWLWKYIRNRWTLFPSSVETGNLRLCKAPEVCLHFLTIVKFLWSNTKSSSIGYRDVREAILNKNKYKMVNR